MKRTYFSILTLLALGGLGLLAYRLGIGLKVTALSSPITWGLWIAAYIFFVGLSAGSFLLSTLIYVFGMRQIERVGRLSLATAVIALGAALLFAFVDLGHPERAWRILTNWHASSVMAWEFGFYMFYIGLTLVELWYLTRIDLVERAEFGGDGLARFLSFGFRKPDTAAGLEAAKAQAWKVARICGIIGIPTAIGVHGGTGSIFAVVMARPYWNTGLFPILFLVSALASGAALITALYALLGTRDAEYLPLLKRLGSLMALFISLDMLLVGAELLVGLYGGAPEHAAPLRAILVGPYAPLFWGAEIGLAFIVPVLLVSLGGNSPSALGLAGLSMVAGIFGVRVNLVIPAYLNPVLEGLGDALHDPRFTYQYFPSAMEFALTAGLVALIVWVFSVAWARLPLRSDELAAGELEQVVPPARTPVRQDA